MKKKSTIKKNSLSSFSWVLYGIGIFILTFCNIYFADSLGIIGNPSFFMSEENTKMAMLESLCASSIVSLIIGSMSYSEPKISIQTRVYVFIAMECFLFLFFFMYSAGLSV